MICQTDYAERNGRKTIATAQITKITAKAPTRIDLAGGWTDTPPYSTEKGGSVVNAAISLYMKVEVTLGRKGQENNVVIRSVDYGTTVEADSIDKLDLDGNADFPKAALKSLPTESPIEIVTSSDAPPGCGLGGSGALGVALTAALTTVRGENLTGTEIPERARDIEVEELKILGGKQDQYAGMFGGFRYMQFKDPHVEMLPLALLDTTIEKLRQNSVLAYTGQSRVSGDIHKNVVEAYRSGNAETLKALDAIKKAADEMKDALLGNDLEAFADLMNSNWEAQKALHPSITNEQIENAFTAARGKGAVAGKALGAGGGGCLYFYCLPGTREEVEETLKHEGCLNLPFDFDFRGLTLKKS
jgi:D-glycero-alpha-D-manno-heptose-7-phosphate kinase